MWFVRYVVLAMMLNLLQKHIVDKLIRRGSLALMNRSPGHKREFSLNDISIQHTFAEHERVPPLYVSLL